MTHVLKMTFTFQCSHEYAVGDETMHILSHYVRADAVELCGKFPDWIHSHHKWVEDIANPVLFRKGSADDDYIEFIIKPGTPVDEIGLLIFARMYHLYMCIIMEDCCWTTQRNHDLDRCMVFISYRGALMLMKPRTHPITRQ